MATHANKPGASPTSPTWGNWSGNIVHEPPSDGENYYFRPTNLADLKSVLAEAKAKGVTVRVSGQRHSQPPLVADDNRGAVAPAPTTYLVDMSCYADLGQSGQDQMVLGPGQNQVTVNPGVREDALDAFLTNSNLMLDAVTAGGFFSIGGMTAVDVHGGTVDAPIFAEARRFVHDPGSRRQPDHHRRPVEGCGRQLAAVVRARVARHARRRDQTHVECPAPSVGEHAPGLHGAIPGGNEAGFHRQVQRTPGGTGET